VEIRVNSISEIRFSFLEICQHRPNIQPNIFPFFLTSEYVICYTIILKEQISNIRIFYVILLMNNETVQALELSYQFLELVDQPLYLLKNIVFLDMESIFSGVPYTVLIYFLKGFAFF
jgi:hypothetical protein